MKKCNVIMITSLLIVMVALIGFSINDTDQSNISANMSSSEVKDSAIWTPVENLDNKTYGQASTVELNLKKLIQDTDYAFSGTIINSQEYEVKWVDESGVLWGPFPSVELDVRITKDYHGKSPKNSDVIKVYYPHSLNSLLEDSVSIKDNSEYIFLTKYFDDEFFRNRSADDKFEQEKHGDVYLSDNLYSLFPIDNGKIILHKDIIDSNSAAKKMAVSIDPSKSAMIAMSSNLASQKVCSYVAIENNNFEELLLAIFATPDKLPSKLQSPPTIVEPELTPLPENTTTPTVPYNGPDIDTKLIDDPLSNPDLKESSNSRDM